MKDSSIVRFGAAGAVLGVLVGVAISSGDRPREVVYSAAGLMEARLTYSMAPILSKHRKGALFTIEW